MLKFKRVEVSGLAMVEPGVCLPRGECRRVYNAARRVGLDRVAEQIGERFGMKQSSIRGYLADIKYGLFLKSKRAQVELDRLAVIMEILGFKENSRVVKVFRETDVPAGSHFNYPPVSGALLLMINVPYSERVRRRAGFAEKYVANPLGRDMTDTVAEFAES